MRILIAMLSLATLAHTQFKYPQYSPDYYGRRWAILRQSHNQDIDGTYAYSYDTENGISVAEQGAPKNLGLGGQAEVVRGQYSYTAPDGTPILVSYTADENGFQATGAHLPTPPPIPVEIQRALAHNAAHPEEEEPYNKRYYGVAK
ncbi:endocuticle structural glycoprotein SgAbd-1-like [Chelonus insularis]|uniref:endocuticle structural glycoprotein SgAbd-1-like n=1 Tax=Chelonus insularis TaxID=460826 RepID=UPI00158B67E7|nr:endocuticle structural glycoprotein SgAbd-1-like [Chelonus insularis]